MDRWLRQLVAIASIGFAVGTCRFTDALRPAGVKNVALAYGGDSTLVQGRVVAAPAIATVDGEPYARARFVFTSSDPTVVAVRGDSLEALKRGTVTLTVALAGSVLPQTPPQIVRPLRVVVGTITLDSARVAFQNLGDTVTLQLTALDANLVPIPGVTAIWLASDTSVVSATPAGRLLAKQTGSATVRAIVDFDTALVAVTVTNDVISLKITPDSATGTSLGDTLIFTAVARNHRGDPVAGASVAWGTPDQAIVELLSDGRAIARAVGLARIIATAGAAVDTSVAVVRNAPATVQFVLPGGITVGPVTRTLTAIGDTESPPVVIANARGAALPRGSVTWSSDDANVVRVTALGLVTTRDTGQTLVRISSGALADSAIYVASNLPASMAVGGLAADTLTALGQSLAYPTEVLNRRGVPIAGYPVAWRSTNRLVVDTVLHDTATAKGFGTTLLIATTGSVVDTFTLVVKHLTRWTADNSSVVSPRVGTALRPYARIQDAVSAAGANDTVIVKVGAGAYSETVALSRHLTLLGDSGAFVAAGRDPATLPVIGHDSGAAGITAYTSAPLTIRYFALWHSLDGPAIDGNGSDLAIEYFYVNPPGSVPSRIGRGISVMNSASGTRIMRSQVNSVRGYGVRLQNANSAVVSGVGVNGVDSLAGLEEGAGIKVVASSTDSIRANVLRRTQIGVLVGGASGGVRVDSNDASTNRVGMRLDGGAVAGAVANDIFDNDSAGVVNPQVATLVIPGNWWGDGLGPRNGGPPAVGDSAAGPISWATVLVNPVSVDLVPAALRLVDGDHQTAPNNTTLSVPLAVRVVGPNGLPVAGVGVTFSITAGSGRLGGGGPGVPLTITSDGSGLAKATFRLPNNITGGNIITVTGATVSIGSVTFTETGT